MNCGGGLIDSRPVRYRLSNGHPLQQPLRLLGALGGLDDPQRSVAPNIRADGHLDLPGKLDLAPARIPAQAGVARRDLERETGLEPATFSLEGLGALAQ